MSGGPPCGGAADHVGASALVRLRRDLGEVAARIGFSAAHHVRDVVDAAARAMELRGRADLEAYVADLVSGKEPAEAWVEEVVVQETYFFRDLLQLEWVASAILGPLALQPPPAPGAVPAPFRIWSAGCAYGEEAHSLAVMLYELGLQHRATILATDVSPAAIRRARLGEYGAFALRGSHGERMRPFLQQVGNRYRVRAQIRALSEFRCANLAAPGHDDDPVPGSVSLILCRNVLLYFSEDALVVAAARFARALAPGGLLVTAPADPPVAGLAGWSRLPGVVGVYQRREVGADGVLKPTHGELALLPAKAASVQVAMARVPTPAARPAAPSVEDDSAEPPTPEHHHHLALSLLEKGDVDGALDAARRVTYLAPDLAMAHFTLALIALRGGSLAIARRGYREAARLAHAAPPDEVLALGDGLRAAHVARSAEQQLERLEATTGLGR